MEEPSTVFKKKEKQGELVSVKLAKKYGRGTVLQIKDERGERYFRIGEPSAKKHAEEFPEAIFANPILGEDLQKAKRNKDYVGFEDIAFTPAVRTRLVKAGRLSEESSISQAA